MRERLGSKYTADENDVHDVHEEHQPLSTTSCESIVFPTNDDKLFIKSQEELQKHEESVDKTHSVTIIRKKRNLHSESAVETDDDNCDRTETQDQNVIPGGECV